MAPPKKRTSKSRRNMRRSHHAKTNPSLSVCPRCAEPKLPHRVCVHCGYYRDKEIVKMDEI